MVYSILMDESARRFHSTPIAQQSNLAEAMAQVSRVVLGKQEQICLAFACLLADGHLLIEDRPGVGKTTLAHALAVTLGLGFKRIQFTSDLLPADIIGVSIYNRDSNHFEFHAGPIVSEVVLADEINRATPKAQSALLEAMEERQITVDGHTHKLPDPFFVIATQNALDLAGTFPLPDSQLDRFLMRLSLGYPEAHAERDLLAGADRKLMLRELPACLKAEEIKALQRAVQQVHASEALLDYIQALLDYTRTPGKFREGLSPRAGLALLRCARAWALIEGRNYCLPEDVQKLLPFVSHHRLHAPPGESDNVDDAIVEMQESVPIP